MATEPPQDPKYYASFAIDEPLPLHLTHNWDHRKELFLCNQVLAFMPDILNKTKSSYWKKILDNYNLYFNSNTYRIRQPRTLKDKFTRLYAKFCRDGKSPDQLTEIETVLHQIRLRKEASPRSFRRKKGSLHFNAESEPPGEGEDEDEDDEDDEDDDEDEDEDEAEIEEIGEADDKDATGDSAIDGEPTQVLHHPPIMPTQQVNVGEPYRTKVSPQVLERAAIQGHLASQNEDAQRRQQQTVARLPQVATALAPSHQNHVRSSAPPVEHAPPYTEVDMASRTATIHLKLPDDSVVLDRRLRNVEEDVGKIKTDLEMIKANLAAILGILNKPKP